MDVLNPAAGIVHMMNMTKKTRGFTLMELMIVVSIVAILGAIALPAYQNSVRKSRRADAMTSLLQLQTLQERWRANNTTYSSSLSNLGWSGSDSSEGYYTIAITAATANAFTGTATPKSSGPQAGDSCGTLSITANGPVIATAAQRQCWNK